MCKGNSPDKSEAGTRCVGETHAIKKQQKQKTEENKKQNKNRRKK